MAVGDGRVWQWVMEGCVPIVLPVLTRMLIRCSCQNSIGCTSQCLWPLQGNQLIVNRTTLYSYNTEFTLTP